MFPFTDPDTGAVVLHRVKPDNRATGRDGKPAGKYLSPSGAQVRAYIPPTLNGALADPGKALLLAEGEKKTLAAVQAGFPCVGLTGVDCWHARRSSALIPDLERVEWKGRQVFIVFDSDAVDNENVQANERLLAAALQHRGALVRIVRLPASPEGAKVGVDDYLVTHGAAELWKLIDQAEEPEAPATDETKSAAQLLDPAPEAATFLDRVRVDGVPRLRFWQGAFWLYRRGAYRELQTSEVRAQVVAYLNERSHHLTSTIVNNVLDQVKSQSYLRSTTDPPCWLESPVADWLPKDVLVAHNALVNLSLLLAGGECIIPPTPRFFSVTALDYDFNADAPMPEQWTTFLGQLWPQDDESISLLQEWFGYIVGGSTALQKILMIVGPTRGGKGTIGRILTALISDDNVASPTLVDMARPFGLWSLIGKPLAVISDARISGRTDQASVMERLLRISGEDALDVDRKCLEPIKAYRFPTRLVLLSNELPNLKDSAGALGARLLILRATESFLGREDETLTERLKAELPGILLWSIAGWERLRQQRRFTLPESARIMVEQFADLSSPIKAFVNDRCVLGPGHRATVDDLFVEWKDWCESHGRKDIGTQQSFGRDLLAAVPTLKRFQGRDGEERYRGYGGITTSH